MGVGNKKTPYHGSLFILSLRCLGKFVLFQMSTLIGYDDQAYFLRRGEREYTVERQMMYYLFYTHGHPVDPYGERLQDLSLLYEAAQVHNDTPLLMLLEREIHLSLVQPSTSDEETGEAMEQLLQIGLYLGGWNGPSEPYPTQLGLPHDTITAEIRADEILQNLVNEEIYDQIKGYQVVSYSISLSKRQLQPQALDLTIEDLLEQLPTADARAMARQLVQTSYYYLSDIYGGSYDLLDSVIRSSII